MAVTRNNQHDFLAQEFCELADKIKAGQVVVTSMQMSSNVYGTMSVDITCQMVNIAHTPPVDHPCLLCDDELDSESEEEFEEQEEDEGFDELQKHTAPTSSLVILAKDWNRLLNDSFHLCHLTIDTAEYPILDSDPSLVDYIKRVLMELGFKGTYTSHRMVPRPGKAPLLEVEGAA